MLRIQKRINELEVDLEKAQASATKIYNSGKKTFEIMQKIENKELTIIEELEKLKYLMEEVEDEE